MRIRGAIHLHSTFSHDGTLTVAELAALYIRNNYQFIAITEHAEDIDEQSASRLLDQCLEHSHGQFCVIPGTEFSCGEFHMLGIATVTRTRQANALAAIETIHRCGGIAVLAHPKLFNWNCPPSILRMIDAVEIWNVNYDGKFLPSTKALSGFAAMRRVNPGLLAVAGHDLHRRESFYDVAIEMDTPSVSTDSILENLRRGHYEIRSRFFRTGPDAGVSPAKATCLRLMSEQLRHVRRARALALGRFS